MRDAPPGARVVTALMLVTALGTAAFWIGFFAGGEPPIINTFCLTVGPVAIWWFWRYRDALAPS